MSIPAELFQFDKDPDEPMYADLLFAQHKAIYDAYQGYDPTSTFFETQEKGAAIAMDEEKSTIVNEELEALYSTAREAMLLDPEGAPLISDAMDDAQDETVAQLDDPMFLYKNIVESLADDPNIHPDLVEHMAEQLLYQFVMADALDRNWWGTTKDVLGLIVMPNISFISSRLTDGGWASSAEDLQKFAMAFQTLSLEERLSVFEEMVDEVKNDTPNAIKAAHVLNSIVTEEGYERIQFDHLLDKIGLLSYALDAATVGALAARKVAHPIALLGKLKRETQALDLADASLRSPAIRSSLGMDQTDAAAHVSPVRFGDELFEGMPDATKMELARQRAMIQEATDDIFRQVLPEGMESLVDTKLAEARANRLVLSNEDGLAVTNVQVVEHGPRSLTLRYDVVTPDTPSLVPDIGPNAPQWQQDALRLAETTGDSWRDIARQVGKPKSTVSDFLRKNYYVRQELQGPPPPATMSRTLEVPYTISDINPSGFNEQVHVLRTPLLHHLASPAFKFQDEAESLVHVMQRGMFQSGKWRNMFNKEYSRVWHMAGKEDRIRVGQALERGNLEGKVFNYQELRGMGISDAGAKQYYSYRELMDRAFLLKEQEIRNMHVISGHHMFNIADNPTPVSLYETPESATAAINQFNANTILVFDDGQQMGRKLNLRATADGSISPELERLMNEGYVVMRPQSELGIYQHMGEGYRFILARRTEVKPIDASTPLLNYQPGYLPIFYGPPGQANYFGQVAKYANVDGRVAEVGRGTRVYFANRTDADQWARQNNIRHMQEDKGMTEAEAIRAVDDPGQKATLPYTIKHDREIRQHEFDNWYAGGPYSGHRATERLRRGIDEQSAEFLDPFYSMQRYLDHISNHMPLSAFRIGLEDKWMKHARAHNAIPKDFSGGFQEAINAVRAQDTRRVGADVQQFLIDSHNHISFNNRVASLGEQQTRGWMVTLAEKMEKNKWLNKDGRALTFLHKIDQAHLPDTIRAITFHSLLGMASPAQFIVQASGSTVAIALDPVNAARGLPYSFGFAALDNIRDPVQRASVLAKLQKEWPGMAERYNAWQKTGLHDAVISTSADYRSVVSSHPVGNQFLDQAVGVGGNIVDKLAFPYKAGELVNRRLSFATAIERHLARGGKLDDAGIKQALNEANKFMLNMDRAVKADFQKGWWGVPTQFLQVHTKFMETLLGHRITPAEKARLMGTQLAIFGGLGIPFGAHMLGYGLTASGVEPGDLSPEMVQIAKGGMANFLLAEVFGFNNEIATRTAIPNGVSQTFENLFLESPALWETLAGAAGSLPQRAFEFGTAMNQMLHANERTLSNMDSADLKLAGQALLEIVSSGRSAVAAYQMFHNTTITADGKPLLFTSDFTTKEIIMRGLGFQLSEVADMRESFQTKRQMDMRVKEYTDHFADYMSRRWNVNDGVSDADARKFEAWFTSAMAHESLGVQEAVRRSILNRIDQGETTLDQSNRDTVERILMDIRHHLDVLSRPAARTLGDN